MIEEKWEKIRDFAEQASLQTTSGFFRLVLVAPLSLSLPQFVFSQRHLEIYDRISQKIE